MNLGTRWSLSRTSRPPLAAESRVESRIDHERGGNWLAPGLAYRGATRITPTFPSTVIVVPNGRESRASVARIC